MRAAVNGVKALCIYCLPFIHSANHFFREINWASQAGFVLAKSMLIMPDCLCSPYGQKWILNNVVHEFSRFGDDLDKLVVLQVPYSLS